MQFTFCVEFLFIRCLKIFKVSASHVQTFVRVGGLEWHMVFYYARNKSHIDTIPAVGPQISAVWLSKCIT